MTVVLITCWVILSAAARLAPSGVTVILLACALAVLWVAGASNRQVLTVLVAGLITGLVFKRLGRRKVVA